MARALLPMLALMAALGLAAPNQAKAQSIAASNITTNSVDITLTRAGYTGNWHYVVSGGTTISCTGNVSGDTVTIANLTQAIQHTVTVYASCEGPPSARLINDKILEATFTTLSGPSLSVDETFNATHNTYNTITATSLTLNISNHNDAWYYKYTSPTGGTCSSEVPAGTSTATVTGLTPDTSYTFEAYSDSCTTSIATAAAVATLRPKVTGLEVSPLENGLYLEWTGQSDAGNYVAQWKAATDSDYNDQDRQESTDYAYVTLPGGLSNAAMVNGTEYSVRVRSRTVGSPPSLSEWSDTVAGTPAEQSLTASDLYSGGATLTLSNYKGQGDWYYKRTSPTEGDHPYTDCAGPVTGATARLEGLSNATDYTFAAYSDSSCFSSTAYSGIVFVNFTASTRSRSRSGGSGGNNTVTGPTCGHDRAVAVGLAFDPGPGYDDAYAPGDAITIAATFSKKVKIFGSGPKLRLEIGGASRTAAYASGSGTETLSFRYEVVEGDGGDVAIPADALAGNFGKVHDLCGLGAEFEDLAAGALPLPAFQVGGPAHVPLLPPAGDMGRQGFVRVINHSDMAGDVSITAIDDYGMRHGPVTLSIGAGAAKHFNTMDLEDGNAAKGLSGGVGPGQGNWRLEVEGEDGLEVEAIGYVRHHDGFLTAMNALAPRRSGSPWVATFNPASNGQQESHLRLLNSGGASASVSVTGMDDMGRSPGGAVGLSLAAGAAAGHSADALETGIATGLSGALGDGEGKWRLTPAAPRDVAAMSLMESPSGHLTNLSTAPANRHGDALVLPLLLSAADPHQRQGFVRIINRSGQAGTVSIQAFDDSTWEYAPLTLSVGANAAVHFNSDDLELGNAAKGLEGSTGPASAGDWHLTLTSDLDIEALAYVRHPDGFLTSMHDVAPLRDEVHRAATFNPASNDRQRSLLRILNLGAEAAEVTIRGIDGDGASPGSEVAVQVAAHASVTLDAKALEEGGDGFEGALGDGAAKWRLQVSSGQPILVMSLMQSPTGHLTNLSARPLQAD